MSTTTKFTPNVNIPLPDQGATGWRDDYLSLASKTDSGLGRTATGDPHGTFSAEYIGQRVFDTSVREYWVATATGSATATAGLYRKEGFPAGTAMIFNQAAAPLGWTLSTTAIDRVLRLATEFSATATSGKGGETDGAWSITGLSHSHTHEMALPDHKHETPVGANNVSSLMVIKSGSWPHGQTGNSRGSFLENAGSSSAFTLWSGGASATSAGAIIGTTTQLATTAVSSDGTWRPAYSNVIVCTKD